MMMIFESFNYFGIAQSNIHGWRETRAAEAGLISSGYQYGVKPELLKQAMGHVMDNPVDSLGSSANSHL
jgi:hypothetical protein